MKNGCMNRPDQTAKSGYWTQDGWADNHGFGTRTPKMVWIPHTMSRECEHSKSTADPACDGCASKRGAV